MKSDTRIAFRKVFEDRHKEPGRNRFRASDPHLAGMGIGNELDISHSLAQLVERSAASRQKGFAIRRRNDPLRASIKELHAERVLQGSNHLRNRTGSIRRAWQQPWPCCRIPRR